MENSKNLNPGLQKILGLDINGMEAGGRKVAGGKNVKAMVDIMDLTDKVAVVTGGSRGLGFCITNRLCEAGAKVVIADLATEFVESALEFFTSKNYDVKFMKTDVRDTAQIEATVNFAKKEFGGIDILVNNASIWKMNELFDITEESWNDIMDVNLKGTVFFTKIVAELMKKQGRGGKIVNVASVAGIGMENAFGCMVQYVASKSGVVNISKSLARELKPLGININCVCPGGMITPGAIFTEIPSNIKEKRENSLAVPVSDPDDVARVVYMMSTGISDYMDGSTVIVDGGAHLMIDK
jgi:NAD(P)-dependent dehydrogenase (short-subunit alcohol dehydrogenase family)